MSESPLRWLACGSRWVRRIEDGVLAALLFGMVLLACAQIVLRNFFDSGVVWADELLRIMLLWTSLVGATIASRDDNHIKIDLVSRFLPERWAPLLRLVLHLFTAATCGVIAWVALRFVRMEAEYGARLLERFPAWWFEAVIPAGFAVIGLRYCGQVLRVLGRHPLEREEP